MKYLLLLAICFASGMAQASGWIMTTIHNKNTPVGIIYYINAIGTHGASKSLTSLRLICSLTNNEQIIGVYWDKLQGREDIVVSTYVDNKLIGIPIVWDNDISLLFKPTTEVNNIMEALSSGRLIKFQWNTDSTQFTTAFNLTGVDLANFNAKCRP